MFVNQDILFHDGTKQFCKYNEQQKHIASFLEQIKALLVVSLCALMEMNCR